MNRQQFRVLYHEFLFRIVDLELLSAHAQGDINKLLGQFASLLILVSVLLALGANGVNGARAWPIQHILISNTMLVVGLFAVLSWDSAFPDRRDVMVLAPLPVRPGTIFLAKAAALATALGVTVATLNCATGLLYPFSWMPNGSGLVGGIRSFAAYWFTMLLAGVFVFCCVLGLQGIPALLLPRRYFLRVSAFLQMAAFCLFVCYYFLEPWQLSNYPSYWFLGLLNTINGSPDPKLNPFTRTALMGLSLAILLAGSAFLFSYLHTLRKIVEEPDIVSSGRGLSWLPRFGNSLQTAVVQFSIRTLLRSRQHRITLAFYLGVAFALVILFLKNPIIKGRLLADPVAIPLLVSTFVMATFLILGTRIVFTMPLAIRANWIFRLTEIRAPSHYFSAIRRAVFVLAVTPVWLVSAAILLWIMPVAPAVGHLIVLGFWSALIAWLLLYNFHKIPFTCSYLPGKSYFHMAFLGGAAFMNIVIHGSGYELSALKNPASYIKMLVLFAVAVTLAAWRTASNSAGAVVDFEDNPDPDVFVLGIYRDGVIPIQANPAS